MPTPKLSRLSETTFSESLKVDREKGVITGVKILGRESKNGRTYSQAAIEQAAKAYEGLGVNLNHPGPKERGDRAVQDAIGWIESVEIKPDGVYGDLHYLKEHPQAPMIVEAAERNPRRFGMSHNAEGKLVRQGGTNTVESIERMHSVDLVQNPATVAGLFESENHMITKTIRECLVGSKYGKLIEEDMIAPMAEMPVDVPADADGDGQIDAAFKAMITSVLDDEALDIKGKLAKIKDILTAQEKLTGPESEAPPAEASEPPPSEEAAESVKGKVDPMLKQLQEQVTLLTREREQLKTEKACRDLLESKNRDVTPVRMESLAALPEAKRLPLVESWPEKVKETKPGRPATSAPIRESVAVSHEKIVDGKSFAEALLAVR